MCILFFFFQAEDGIRDGTVTGVQTCALPIYAPRESRCSSAGFAGAIESWGRHRRRPSRRRRACEAPPPNSKAMNRPSAEPRSEERRVGKEYRAQGAK